MSVAICGPFTLSGSTEQGWTIAGADGHSVVSITAILIDGSYCRHPDGTRVYPNAIIRSRADSAELARFVLRALNLAWSG